MEIIKTSISELYTIKPTIFTDNRGYFFESYNEPKFKELGLNFNFVQDNESKSQKGVIRGLHFQKPPFSQAKLVRVIKGAVLDIAVDLRTKSPTYGKWNSVLLTEENKLLYLIPEGFAHGFATLENDTIFSYKCTNMYNKESEGCIQWNDSKLNINWAGVENPIISEKDKTGDSFSDFISPF